MSALRITAEVGRRYLMTDGERLRVIATTAHTVTSRALYQNEKVEGRSIFESHIESVLE